jgi:integrase
VKDQLESLRRRYGTRPNKKKPLTIELLVKVVNEIPDDLTGARDSALLLLCFAAGGLRRSEVVSLDVEHVQFVDKGALVLLGKSKTDQEGKGVLKAVPFAKQGGACPVRALRRWLSVSGITSGAIFRSLDDARASRRDKRPDDRLSDHAVAEIVKGRLAAAGLEDIDIESFSGHSIRRGFATSAAEAGQGVLELAKTVGWSDTKMALEYVDQANLFEKHAGKDLF